MPHRLTIRAAARSIALLVAEGAAMLHRRSIRAATLSIALIVVTASITQAAGVGRSPGTGKPAAAVAAAGIKTSSLSDHAKRGPIAHGSPKRASSRTSGAYAPKLLSPFTHAAGSGGSQAPQARAPRAAAPTNSTTNGNPDIQQHPGFQGMTRSGGPDNDGEPPDPFVAVGPEHVMQILNSSFRTTDRQGAEADISSLSGFVDSFSFAGLGSQQWFDPRVIYDSLHNRWLMTMAGIDCVPSANSNFGNGYLFFATSDTIDPTGFWTGSYFQFFDALVDFPAPGTSTDKIAFASNIFSMDVAGSCAGVGAADDYVGSDILVMDWADWFGTDNDVAFREISTDTSRFTPRVAVQTPATSNRLHVVIEKAGAPAPHVEYLSIKGSAAANTVSVDVIVDLTTSASMDPFLDPPAPVQPGPDTIDNAVDGRPTDAIWQNNRLTFVSTYPCTPTGDSGPHDCVRVSTLNTAPVPSAPTVFQDMLVADLGEDSYMGGVGYAGNGTLHVVWTRSSATAGDFPSSYHAYQLPSDAANTRSASFPLSGGVGTGVYTGERWGDYVGVAQDPLVPSAVWQANQYAGGADEWKTYVSRLQAAGTTYFPITPVRVLDTRINRALSGPFSAGVPRTWAVAAHWGIPANAVAVTGNVTVTGQTAAGYVAVTPTPVNPPPSSTINFPTKDNRANNLVVPLSATGTLSAVYRAGGGNKTQLIFDVTGYFLANDNGATFKSMVPKRILDTRSNIGLTGKFTNGTARQLQVTGPGLDDVPGNATAITGNLTVTQQSAGGYLSVSPTAPPAVPATSNLNFPVSDNRANGLYAPLDGTGKLWIVYKSGVTGAQTHVILDVTGYFVHDLTGLRFVPMNPARIMDTRSSAVLSQLHNPFNANSARVLAVDSHWGVPPGTDAVSGNLTVTGQTGGGFVAVSPTAPPPVPATSTLNFPLGDSRANGLVAPLNGSGDTFLVYVGATGKKTDLILDLSGYFE